MQDQFFYFYLTVVISCLIAAMIMPRIWPLKIFLTNMLKSSEEARNEQLPEGKTALKYGFDLATEVGIKSPGFKEFLISGFKTVVDMWFVILPVVMSIGTIATIANYRLFLKL